MAINIFDKFGIKEVANVYFQALADEPRAGIYEGDIVLFLDSLKVSTIEQTAENTAAQGGWGNPRLVQWDYGKEINLTLTDALISLESLRFMLGGAVKRSNTTDSVWVQRTEEVTCGAEGVVPKPKDHITGAELQPEAKDKHPIKVINLTTGVRTQIQYDKNDSTKNIIDGSKAISFKNSAMLGSSAVVTAAGDRLRIFWEEEVTATDSAVEVVISPETFPGTYKIVGDTFMRNAQTGRDEAFQFIINKAKVQSNVTITLEAEGDPSTFEMTINVLRSEGEDGNEMMCLVRYGLDNAWWHYW